MFSVYSARGGQPFKHEVKALDIIWRKFPQYGPQNTIHVDDLSRNFALNPGNGLKVQKPSRSCDLSRDSQPSVLGPCVPGPSCGKRFTL